jgi:hypothetical protein
MVDSSLSRCCAHDRSATTVQHLANGRTFEHPDAGRLQRRPESIRKLSRVEMTASMFEDAAEETLRKSPIRSNEVDIPTSRTEKSRHTFGPPQLSRRQCGRHVAGSLVVALDAEALYQAFSEVDGTLGDSDELAGPASVRRGQDQGIAGDGGGEVAGVAWTRPSSAEFGFDQDDVDTPFGQPQRCCHSGVPPTNNRNIRADFAGERR